jgi:hypothetical protein
MKKCFNLLKRHCPSCHKTINWSVRRRLIDKSSIKCTNCKSLLAINQRDKIVNAGLFVIFYLSYLQFFEVDSVSVQAAFVGFIFLELYKTFNLLFSFTKVGCKTKASMSR